MKYFFARMLSTCTLARKSSNFKEAHYKTDYLAGESVCVWTFMPFCAVCILQVDADSIVASTTVVFIPEVKDHGKMIYCRARNMHSTAETKEDQWKIDVRCKYKSANNYPSFFSIATPSQAYRIMFFSCPLLNVT